MDDELVIEQVDRDALCDILGVPRDWASPDKDGNKELARALPVLARHRIAAEAQARTQGMLEAAGIAEGLPESDSGCNPHDEQFDEGWRSGRNAAVEAIRTAAGEKA